jgi:hypothetical protein
MRIMVENYHYYKLLRRYIPIPKKIGSIYHIVLRRKFVSVTVMEIQLHLIDQCFLIS